MWRKKLYRLLQEEIKENLSVLPDNAGLKELVKESINQNWEIITSKTNQNHPWPLLPLIVCEAISGQYDKALPAASALYLLKISAEIFDDIEDADSPGSLSARSGPSIAANVATTILMLAEREITRLVEKTAKVNVSIKVMDAINSAYITACSGQHLDLSPNFKNSFSEDHYLHVIEMKSTSIIQCACKVGALLADTNSALVNKFGAFGYNLGMASQIANDILGIINGNDILKAKITLPVIFAFNQANRTIRNQLKRIYINKNQAECDPLQMKDLLYRCGAIQYTATKMEYYKQQVMETMSKIEKQSVDVTKLKIFLA